MPSTNLAESFNLTWSNSDTNNSSLVDAAYYDIVEAIMLETELECFEEGTFKGGEGPNNETRGQKQQFEQMKHAKEYVREFAKEEVDISKGQESWQQASEYTSSKKHKKDSCE